MKTPPNVLVLMSDEHRADVAGFAGNTVVRTPNIDRIAAAGTVFTNAYTPSPVCVPARQSIAAGQLPKECGCEGWFDLPEGYLTYARHFSREAYYTVACGKLHHEGPDQLQGWLQRIGADCKMSPRYLSEKNVEAYKNYPPAFGDQKWSDNKEIKRAGPGNAYHVRTDKYTTQGAVNFIDDYFNAAYYDRERNQQPLMLKASFIQPHYPYYADEELFKYYLNRVEPYLEQQPPDHPFLSERTQLVGEDVTEREVRRATAAYYAMIESVDRHIGEIITALEAVGQNVLEDWVIVYMSDHGEMLGEHSIWEKQKFYEGSVKVPLVIKAPHWMKLSTSTVEENVSLIDLFATLCDLCEISQPSGISSRTLMPFMRGDTFEWKNEVVSQFSKENQPLLPEESEIWNANRIREFGGMNLMIKHDHLKYQYYGPDLAEVLFDLKADPAETTNFMYDEQYKEAIERFRLRAIELGYAYETGQ